MTSRFKFRAWNGYHMLNMPLDSYYGFERFFGLLAMQENESDKNIILMQSTGLTDKNGVEIFEGDVVLVNGVLKQTISLEVETTTSSGHGESYFNTHLRIVSGYGRSFDEAGVEIIGNIHEHPELLENPQ